MGAALPGGSAAKVFSRLAESVPAFRDTTFQNLAEVEEQWPIIGREDLYYGGTSYDNTQGLGKQLPLPGDFPSLSWPTVSETVFPKMAMMAFPITRLYDQGTTLVPAQLLRERIGEPYVILNMVDATRLKVRSGDVVRVTFTGQEGGVVVVARVDEVLPERVMLVPRSFGIPLCEPAAVDVRRDT
jgi:NADH-quinone oxidoreductase subunit G